MDNKYYVYKYYIDDQLIYVGRTNNFVERFKQHLRENSYYDKVNKIDIATFNSDGDMMIYEKYYIIKFHPPLNKVDMQFSSPSIELPEPDWITYSREDFNNIYIPNKQNINKTKEIKTILPNNTIELQGNVSLLWFKQFDMNTQIFNYKQKYSIHFETDYDDATPRERKTKYKWDKNEIINIWCLVAENQLDKMPYIKNYPYDAPSLHLTIKENNYDIMYLSLNWFSIQLDKLHGLYLFGPKIKNQVIDENGIFHIEELIQDYEILKLNKNSKI